MSTENNVFAPWEWKEMTYHKPNEEPQGTTIMDRGGYYISHQLNIRPPEKRKEIANVIVTAVNNTYGSGINPEAVPDMLSALEGMKEPFSHIGGVGREAKFKAMQALNAAIQKAKL